ncbi:MAG: hypothetical protein JOZ29_10705 [Deltaproteobacteria bacterium]|nr:hypothetical protein [Deltaproteobacteria bacterium]MBV8452727.1 hypothetical protein [Deltaproteobacteria bacterium]
MIKTFQLRSAFSRVSAPARLIDGLTEIINQDFNILKVIMLLVTADVAVIAFARLVALHHLEPY